MSAVGANVLALPAASCEPAPDQLEPLGPAGRRFVGELLGRYELSAIELALVIEAGHIWQRLTDVRVPGACSLVEHKRIQPRSSGCSSGGDRLVA